MLSGSKFQEHPSEYRKDGGNSYDMNYSSLRDLGRGLLFFFFFWGMFS
jgi:hypothetical protein